MSVLTPYITVSPCVCVCVCAQCSLQECGDEEWNMKEASRFRRQFGQLGVTFPCFYDPARPRSAIVLRTSAGAVLHAVLWSCLCLGTGAVLWIGLCLGCCTLGTKGHDSDYEGKKAYAPLPT